MPPDKARTIKWRLHLRSSPGSVFLMLTTDEGRERFWAENSKERDRVTHFTFSEGSTLNARVIEKAPPKRFVLEYFGGSVVTFDLKSDGENGTDLSLSG